MMRTLAALAALSASAGCGGTPDAERSRLEVFDALAKLMLDYNEALGRGEPVPIEAHTVKLQNFVSKEFEAVLEGLGSNDADRRAVAAFALGFSRKRGAVAPLLAATSAPEAGVRANAVASLGVLGFEDVPVEPFRKLLEDPQATVREAVLFGLRQLVDEKNDRGLIEAVHARLSDPVANVRNEALILLRKCRRGESVPPILKSVVRDREPLVRMNAAVTLGKIGPAAQAATPALVEMLRDEESKVVDAAYKALNLIHEKDFDRSYGTWKDWYEDEQRHHYLCLDHKDAAFAAPGDCRNCGKKMERVLKDTVKRSEPVPSFFTCPDHPEIQTASPSACGKTGCGKTLVASRPPPALYRCSDHLEVMTTSPAICGKPGCGKALVPAAPKK